MFTYKVVQPRGFVSEGGVSSWLCDVWGVESSWSDFRIVNCNHGDILPWGGI